MLERVNIDGRTVTIKWFPAHAGNEVSELATNHNETANAVARGLAGRAAAVDPSVEWWTDTKDRYDTFQGITKYYRNNRRVLAPPLPEQTREEASTFRRLQTNSLMTQVLMKHIQPELYKDDVCVLCNSARAATAHFLWDCEVGRTRRQTGQIYHRGSRKQCAVTTRTFNYQPSSGSWRPSKSNTGAKVVGRCPPLRGSGVQPRSE